MKITSSTKEDISEIFRLYKLATEFQKIKFPENHWPKLDQSLVATEVNENRQYKLTIGNQIACVWAITYSDPQIWEAVDNDSSIFIHRIATNPDFRGNNFVKLIAQWARSLAQEENKSFIRMDTCGKNESLIKHYERCGFEFLGTKKLTDASGLPSHYLDVDVCFFEIEVAQSS